MHDAPPPTRSDSPARTIIAIVSLAVLWGFNWPILKLAVTEMPPLGFRSYSLLFAALGMFAVAMRAGDTLRVPRGWWGRLVVLALFNMSIWSGLTLFGIQLLPAGRAAILSYTMPVWGALCSLALLGEQLSRRRIVGLVLGMAGVVLLLGDDLARLQRSPAGALFILGGSVSWALGTTLLRKWKPPLPETTLFAWIMLIGWVPLTVMAPWFAPWPDPREISLTGWFAILYNVALAGTLANWVWFRMARRMPVALSSVSSLPVPIVGVFSSMLLLGERPGLNEWLALVMIIAAIIAVLGIPLGWPLRLFTKRR